MYNGIGILTPRGTGTSGYVQTNKFNLRGPPPQRHDRKDDAGPAQRKPNEGILEHNRKREIELEVEVMRAQLEDDGLGEDEIEEKLAQYRMELEAKAELQSAQAAPEKYVEKPSCMFVLTCSSKQWQPSKASFITSTAWG